MSERQEPLPTRRTALRSLGVATGAAALGLGADWNDALAEGVPPGVLGTNGEPIDSGSGGPSGIGGVTSVTPGLTYATFGMFAFQPNDSARGFIASGTGSYCNISPGHVVANLQLPTGALIKEVQFAGENSSGVPMDYFIERYSLTTGFATVISSVTIPTGGTVLQSGSATPAHVVDADYSYDAAVYSSSSVRMYSCRIGYAGPFGFMPVDPQVRKLDTRLPGPLTGKFLAGQTRTLALTPQLPPGAAAALLNVTVTNTVAGGFLTLFPTGTTNPGTSSINWFGSGQTLANNATVAVSGVGQVNIYCGGTGGPQADVIVDLLGYLR